MPRNRKKHLANRTRNDYSISYENLRRRPAHWLYGQIPKNNIIETVQMCHFKHRRLNFRQPEKEAFLCPHFFASCISTALEAVILAAVALAGIVLGKKFRDKKSTQQ